MPTMLKDLLEQRIPVYAVGKIKDIFAGTTFTKAIATASNDDGLEKTERFYQDMQQGLLFVNLVDFDMKYGHRRDCIGYGSALAQFDAWLKQFTDKIDKDTIVVITADHGCDPAYTGTDHTREYVPLLMYGASIQSNDNNEMVTYNSFADLGATLADYFEISYHGAGESFADTVFLEKRLTKE